MANEPIATTDAFDALFAAEFAAITRAVFLVTGDLAIAEEIAQEAFARAWSRWHRVAGLDRPGAWVRVVAESAGRGRPVDHVRSARRRDRPSSWLPACDRTRALHRGRLRLLEQLGTEYEYDR